MICNGVYAVEIHIHKYIYREDAWMHIVYHVCFMHNPAKVPPN